MAWRYQHLQEFERWVAQSFSPADDFSTEIEQYERDLTRRLDDFYEIERLVLERCRRSDEIARQNVGDARKLLANDGTFSIFFVFVLLAMAVKLVMVTFEGGGPPRDLLALSIFA
jgi:hypothetical protein